MGYVEGRNVVFEVRATEQYEELPALVADLVRRQVAVIFAWGTANSAQRKRCDRDDPSRLRERQRRLDHRTLVPSRPSPHKRQSITGPGLIVRVSGRGRIGGIGAFIGAYLAG